MKYRESGMPPEDLWDTFFTPAEILEKLGVDEKINTLVDVGCGYGTFLIPAAELVGGKVIGIDIDDDMIKACKDKIQDYNVPSVELIYGDITTDETMNFLSDYIGKIDYISLFNILHCEEPLLLLKKGYEILNDKGKIGVIHWKSEETPRGPSIEIRPKPEMIIHWALQAGFTLEQQLELPPYHFGLVFKK